MARLMFKEPWMVLILLVPCSYSCHASDIVVCCFLSGLFTLPFTPKDFVTRSSRLFILH